MYFPYLHAKRFEQIAVRESADVIANSGKVFPILEPVSKSTREMRKNLVTYQETNIPFIVIANPLVGDLKDTPEAVHTEILTAVEPGRHTMLGYNLTGNTTVGEINEFMNRYPNHTVCLIHQQRHPDPKRLNSIDRINWHIFIENRVSLGYQITFAKKNRVLISDGFPRQRRNADYAENPDEFFSDLFAIYKDAGFEGFGDYTITGGEYRRPGGIAHAVAIHLTYLRDLQEIWIWHFISDRTEGPTDTAGKFLEALNKLVDYVKDNFADFSYSTACAEFIDLHNRQHFPGLATVKKLSIRHHLELMAHLL